MCHTCHTPPLDVGLRVGQTKGKPRGELDALNVTFLLLGVLVYYNLVGQHP